MVGETQPMRARRRNLFTRAFCRHAKAPGFRMHSGIRHAGMKSAGIQEDGTEQRFHETMNRSGICAAMLVIAALTFSAQPAQAAEAAYEKPLLRLAEVLGAVHYLRNLCGETSDAWRGKMQELLTTEAPSPERREKLVASFNQGYRAFAGTYQSCTQQARSAISGYMEEGARLSKDIAQRYGN